MAYPKNNCTIRSSQSSISLNTNTAHILTWLLAAVATAGVIIRPFKIPEAVWAVAGAVLLVFTRLLQPREAWVGIASGLNVYLFLAGMMLLAEVARQEQLFDWLAALATKKASGSANRLFVLIYLVGIAVTALLSNDATAVVLTPAVAAAMRTAKISAPLPYLFICAFIANAASFVLPIANPANLVIYGAHMPALQEWLSTYLLPSLVSIAVTFLLLYRLQRKQLSAHIATDIPVPPLSRGGKTAGWGIVGTTVGLLAASFLNIQLGLPAALAGTLIMLIVIVRTGRRPAVFLTKISWSVLPLVAGLFVIVEALHKTGLIQVLSSVLEHYSAQSIPLTAWVSGLLVGFGTNLTNNLPAGLIAGHVIQSAPTPHLIQSAVLIGIDLGPNLSVTGSLATILWLIALRREGITVSAVNFLRLGAWVMTIALVATLGTLYLTAG